MPSFRGWVHEEVNKRHKMQMPGVAHEVVDHTFAAIRERAEMRGRQCVIEAMGKEAAFRYAKDPHFHLAIDVIVQAVVAGVFGEYPLTEDEKIDKLASFDKVIKTLLDAPIAVPTHAHMKPPPAPITMAEVKKAAAQFKQEMPQPSGTKTGRMSFKSGLPAAQTVKKDEVAALVVLAAQVEKASETLLGITQKAKYEEMVGIDPEEI